MDKTSTIVSNQQEDANNLRAYWGTVTLSAMLIAICVYFAAVALRQPQSLVVELEIVTCVLSITASIASIVLANRNKLTTATQVMFYAVNLFGLVVIALFDGRTLTASFSILAVSAVMSAWLLPSQLKRQYAVLTAGSFALMWIIEWLNPVWRIPTHTVTVGPAAVIVLLILIAALLFWSREQVVNHIRLKLLTSSVVVMILLFLGMSAFLVYTVVSRNQSESRVELSRTKSAVTSNINELESLALALSTELSNVPQVQEAFARHDRETLAQLTLPLFETVQNDFSVKQYQFILPNSFSFLRLHQPDKYGDDLSSFRATVVEVNNTKQPVSGLEIGRGGLGVRGEAPVFYNGTYVGVIDVGLDLGDSFLEKIQSEYGVDAQILLDAEAAQIATFEGSVADTQTPNSNLLLQASTFSTPVFLDANSYTNALNGQEVTSRVSNNGKTYAVISSPLKDHSGNVIGVLEIYVDRTAVTATQTQNLVVIILVSILAVVAGTYIQMKIIDQTIQPVNALTESAVELSRGNLEHEVNVNSKDELGLLATAFNNMASRIRELVGSLEQRVAARTRNLELAAEVGRTVSQVRDLEFMLKDACELILKEFDLYYVQVYLTDPSASKLKLEAGTGTVGEQLLERRHSLPLNINSINGRAAVEKRSVVIPDTAKNATFRKNPLLPETRSEMSVPLIVANKVVGVLDMQSSNPGILTNEILPAFEALAGQLAVAIQNANLLKEVEDARVEVEKQAARLVNTNWQNYLDAIHKPENTGFVFDGKELSSLNNADEMQPVDNGKSMAAPIEILGEKIGSLVIETGDENTNASAAELINVVAHQVAQQIENLRLLETAERFRIETEEASRRLTREGWQKYTQSNTNDNLGYYYDLKEVRPVNGNKQTEENTTVVPLKIRDEAIGKLAVQGLDKKDAESLDLALAVADRLSAHIESLRLLEETEESRAEFQQSQERLSEALNIARLGNWEYDVEKDIFTFNDNFYAVFHTNVQEVGSYNLSSAEYAQRFVHPEDAPLVGGEIGKALNSPERHYATTLEHRVIFADGGIGYIAVNVNVERDENGKISRFYGANQDITERKQAEEELRSREAQLSTALAESQSLYRINEAISSEADLGNIYQTVAQLSCDELDFNGSWIGVFEPENEALRGVAGINMPEERLHGILSVNDATPASLAARTRQLITVNDPAQDERMIDIPQDVRVRMGKALSTPIMVGQELLGVIAVTRPDDAGDITPREERMLQAIAIQLGIVMQRIQVFEQAQKQAQRESMLNTINQKIQSATSVEAVLQIAARELGHALGAPMTIAQLNLKENNGS
ncbi:MAG: GAF domain-containing protein [Anaerolineales bacterium]|nr:GAF domain-containing protein [Anaerolineales bacterium]